jgi:hypothetical protein
VAVTFICVLHNSRQSLGRGGRLVGICHYSWVRSLAEVLRCAPARPNIGLKIFAKYLFRQAVGRRRACCRAVLRGTFTAPGWFKLDLAPSMILAAALLLE